MKDEVAPEEAAAEKAAQAAEPSTPVENEVSGEENAPAEEEAVEVDPLAAMEAEIQKYKDESLRRAAEMDNYRKRMAKELEESRKFANQRLLSELLPVLDNFGMGMQMAEQEQGSMLYQGMAMVQGQLNEFFNSQGVKPVDIEVGGDFDPNFHEAVSQEESDEIEEGKVLRVVRRGYFVGERLLRPANVIVAKKVEAAEEAPASEGEEEGQ
ncbi:nucleotide exchange factor GrpE [Roseibacillus ishigakijimensis]|uniref:Protein GrpE n=1 Tax=Roseibacillus ishigakijimensis TaxID=454146 RepID=A0A934RT25_9BACT|nr:nucleotide exchange factor GrpE [Roseibacillus ishigakijimensis]MBK1834928.1 nucleotide exchange factor GrpE [Roseibacillus ishigakijimensis]